MYPLTCFVRQDFPKTARPSNTVARYFANHEPPVRCRPVILLPPFGHPWFDAGPHNGRPTRSVCASTEHAPLSLMLTRPSYRDSNDKQSLGPGIWILAYLGLTGSFETAQMDHVHE
jgi:hypothetical protein